MGVSTDQDYIAQGGHIAKLVQNRSFPIIGRGSGVWSFIHIAVAAEAKPSVLQAVEARSSMYKEFRRHLIIMLCFVRFDSLGNEILSGLSRQVKLICLAIKPLSISTFENKTIP
jgi:hypothetical protein